MDGQWASVQLADHATRVGVEARFNFRSDDGGSVFGAENDMRQKIGEFMGPWDFHFRG
jgi:hypothetical protein